jgi:CMP-N-acetylneuraminic acid synthetase
MLKRLAIIPARGGSKRIKLKNIKNFLGKPLIYYTLQAAKKSKLFDKIHVSTESQKIKREVNKMGLKVDFYRPKHLSGDKIPISKVIQFVVDKYFKDENKKFDEIWLLFATNPFIKYSYLKKANEKYKKNKYKFSIMAVTKYNLPIYWSLRVNKKKILTPIFKSKINSDSKKFKKIYCDAGMFVIYQKNFFYNKNIKPKYKAFEIPWWQSVDIDNIDDLEAAKKII